LVVVSFVLNGWVITNPITILEGAVYKLHILTIGMKITVFEELVGNSFWQGYARYIVSLLEIHIFNFFHFLPSLLV
jgi:hypothetical protein